MKKEKKEKKLKYTNRSSMRTFSIKCYEEQISSLAHIPSIPSSVMEVYAIVHDKDYSHSDFWSPSIEKSHIHIIGRCAQPTHLSTILSTLGVCYRQGEDDTLIRQHGIETVSHFPSMLLYLTHDTEAAQKDGKHNYSPEEVVTNCPQRYKSMYNEYKSKLLNYDYEELSSIAYSYGLQLKDFSEFESLLTVKDLASKYYKIYKKKYNMGIQEKISSSSEVDRLCIFISGAGNTSKSYSSLQACRTLFYNPYIVNGGSSGAFDAFEPSYNALICNDYTLDNILNLSDNKVVQTYGRLNKNSWWMGSLLIVTSNKSFEEWLLDCHISDPASLEAMRTRFFVISMRKSTLNPGYNGIVTSTPSSIRGDADSKISLFRKWLIEFNRCASSYAPVSPTLAAYDFKDCYF